MMSASDCFRKAKELAEKAAKASDEANRTVLRATAQQWLTLGEQAQAMEARKPQRPVPTSDGKAQDA